MLPGNPDSKIVSKCGNPDDILYNLFGNHGNCDNNLEFGQTVCGQKVSNFSEIPVLKTSLEFRSPLKESTYLEEPNRGPSPVMYSKYL